MSRQPILFVPATCRLLFLLACSAVAGCSSSPSPVVRQEDVENLTKVGAAYAQATDKLGHPPQNPEQLKPFLKQYGDPETMLRSPHDGLPYVILWGRSIRNASFATMPPPIIAYEQQGVSGKRYVLTVMGIMPMTDEEFGKVNLTKKQ
jgi:hypothetical protein